jgi:hypothetical protein
LLVLLTAGWRAPTRAAELKTRTDDLLLVYRDPSRPSWLLRRRCFENSMEFRGPDARLGPSPVASLNGFSDSKRQRPRARICSSQASRRVLRNRHRNERLNWLFNHELVHATVDRAWPARFFGRPSWGR